MRSCSTAFRAVVLLCAAVSVALAQRDSLWARTIYGTGMGDDEVQALASDSSGNVCALIRGEIEGDPAIITVKYSPSGERLWWRHFTCPGGADPSGIAADRWGNVLITGTGASSTTSPDILTLKYSPAGDSCWVAYFDAAGMADCACAIQVDVDCNAYVSGTSNSPTGGMDCTLIKYSSSGAELWSRVFSVGGTRQDSIMASVLDPAGYIYQVGSSSGRSLAIKYTFAGDRVWVRTGDESTFDYLSACAVDANHALLACGGTEFSTDSSSILTLKYDPGGARLWLRRISSPGFHGNHAVAVVSDDQANAVVTGWWYDTANVSANGLLVKYSPDGSELWRRLDPDTAGWHGYYPWAMALWQGEIYVVGERGPHPSASGMMVVKYSLDGDSLWVRYDSSGLDYFGIGPMGIACVPGGVCAGASWVYRSDPIDVVKCYRADGTEEWTQSLNCSSTGHGPAGVHDLVLDRQGNVIAAG